MGVIRALIDQPDLHAVVEDGGADGGYQVTERHIELNGDAPDGIQGGVAAPLLQARQI